MRGNIKEALEDKLINLKGRDFYKEFEDSKQENQGFFQRAKKGLMVKQSMRMKETILPIIDKLEKKLELSGQERASLIEAIRHKMSFEDIQFIEKYKNRFMWYSVAATGTSLASCFVFSMLSKRYVKTMMTYKILRFPVAFAIFAGGVSFTMPPAFEELGEKYGEMLEKHKEHLNRETICAYFEIDKLMDSQKISLMEMERVKGMQQNFKDLKDSFKDSSRDSSK